VKTVLRLLAAAFALIGIANVTYQVVTTAIGPPEIVILTVQLAFFLLVAGILLATPALLRRR
jgi:hypothetical protein